MRKVVRNRKPDKDAKANSGSSSHSVRLVEGGAEGRGRRERRGGGGGGRLVLSHSLVSCVPKFFRFSSRTVNVAMPES